MSDTEDFDEERLLDGPDVDNAQAAVERAKEARVRTDSIIIDLQRSLSALKQMHRENHYAEKFRAIIHGRV